MNCVRRALNVRPATVLTWLAVYPGPGSYATASIMAFFLGGAVEGPYCELRDKVRFHQLHRLDPSYNCDQAEMWIPLTGAALWVAFGGRLTLPQPGLMPGHMRLLCDTFSGLLGKFLS